MSPMELRQAREAKGWTQQEAASRLGFSQTYLSLLEQGKRQVPKSRVQRVLAVYDSLWPLALPMHGQKDWAGMDGLKFSHQLAGLDYPGFAYLRARATWNPAELLLAALTKDNLESRSAEALPWLVLSYSNMDWNWVVRQSKMHDVQNRLGFVLTLARSLAGRKDDTVVTNRLSAVEQSLHASVLLREVTFCREHMPEAERRWLKLNSTPEAKRWNVLSDLSPEHLTHAIAG
jgi:transcriptional regulator with XRE-family HTH domain